MIDPADRWRLILGQQRGRMTRAAREVDAALAEQGRHGRTRREPEPGSIGTQGGHDPPFPTVRAWADALEERFGAELREEVLAATAADGSLEAAAALDPDGPAPSIELLEQLLRLRGALPPEHLVRLRPLLRRAVKRLEEELATRARPALVGLATPRPSYRARGPLDLQRTVRLNLRTLRRDEEGAPRLVPERPVFRTRARRSLDWRLIVLIDVSASMERSTIHAAVMAAVLARLPALRVDVLAFSTQVVDLSAHLDDPLALLLAVRVGGGTHIASALRAARARIRVPSRTLVIVLSDFEEGDPVRSLVAEVRALVESGVKALGLAALGDDEAPRYSAAIAGQLVAAGMPIAALTPLELARWIRERIT